MPINFEAYGIPVDPQHPEHGWYVHIKGKQPAITPLTNYFKTHSSNVSHAAKKRHETCSTATSLNDRHRHKRLRDDDVDEESETRRKSAIADKDGGPLSSAQHAHVSSPPTPPHRPPPPSLTFPFPHLLTADAMTAMLSLRPPEYGMVKMRGKVIPTPRFIKMYLHNYRFTGMDHSADPVLPAVWQPLLDWLNSEHGDLKSDCHERKADGGEMAAPRPSALTSAATTPPSAPPLFNGVLVNWYMDGHHYIGPHSDDTRQLHPQSPIVTVSFGAERVFRVRKVAKATSTSANSAAPAGGAFPIVRDFVVANGDVLVMGGAFQQFYKHEIVKIAAKEAAAVGPRISVTFRQYLKK